MQIKKFIRVGGEDIHKGTSNLVKRQMSKEVMAGFNMYGGGDKGKLAFTRTLYGLIRGKLNKDNIVCHGNPMYACCDICCLVIFAGADMHVSLANVTCSFVYGDVQQIYTSVPIVSYIVPVVF